MVDTFGIVAVSLLVGFPLMWCLIEVVWPWLRWRNEAPPTGYSLPPQQQIEIQQQQTVGYAIPFPQQVYAPVATSTLPATVTDPQLHAWTGGPNRVAEGYYAYRPDGSAYWVTTKWPNS